MAVAEIHGVSIDDTNQIVEQPKQKALPSIMAIDKESVKGNPVLGSYRDLVQKIGRSSKKFPPSAESLIEIIQFKGKFPHINAAVDAYNTIAAKTFLAIGVNDMAKVGKVITFRLSKGNEPFISVGSDHAKYTQPGDYVYADEHKVIAWLDSKDSDEVKLTTTTKDIIMIIQGTPCVDPKYKLDAVTEAATFVTQVCGGTFEAKLVG